MSSYQRGGLALNATHTICLIKYTYIHVCCKDDEDNPLAGQKYEIELPDGEKIEGQLDNDGWAKHDNILPGKAIFRLIFPKLRHLRLKFMDEDGEPFANLPFEIELGPKTFSGFTSDEGRVIADIPDDQDDGELTIWVDEDKSGESYTWPIKISQVAK